MPDKPDFPATPETASRLVGKIVSQTEPQGQVGRGQRAGDGDDGQPRAELFVADKLHFSEAGYDVVTSAIKWQKDMEAFARQDATNAPAKGGIVFVGSSSIVRWK